MTFSKWKTDKKLASLPEFDFGDADVLFRGPFSNTLHPLIQDALDDMGIRSANDLSAVIKSSPKYDELCKARIEAEKEKLRHRLAELEGGK